MRAERAARPGLKRRIEWSKKSMGHWDPIDDAAAALGANVKLLAESHGLSIRRLAEKAGVAERTLWNILGEKTLPHFSTVVFLAEVLKVTPSDLLLSNKKLKAKLAVKRRGKRKAKGPGP